MKNLNKVLLVGAVVALVGCFLPIATVDGLFFSKSLTMMDVDLGWIVLVAAVVSLALAFTKYSKVSAISSIIGIAMAIMWLSGTKSDDYFDLVTINAGIYIIMLGFAVAIVGAFKKPNDAKIETEAVKSEVDAVKSEAESNQE